jgi:hypothetical protein
MFAYTTTLRTASMMPAVHQHEPISLEVDARFGAPLDHRGDLPRERPAEREAESG